MIRAKLGERLRSPAIDLLLYLTDLGEQVFDGYLDVGGGLVARRDRMSLDLTVKMGRAGRPSPVGNQAWGRGWLAASEDGHVVTL